MSDDKQAPGSNEPADIDVFRRRRDRELLEQRAINTVESIISDGPSIIERVQRGRTSEGVSLAAIMRPFAHFAEFLMAGGNTGAVTYMMFTAYLFKNISDLTLDVTSDGDAVLDTAPKLLLLSMLQHSTSGTFASFKSSLQVVIRFWPEESVPPQLADMYQGLTDNYAAFSAYCESE